ASPADHRQSRARSTRAHRPSRPSAPAERRAADSSPLLLPPQPQDVLAQQEFSRATHPAPANHAVLRLQVSPGLSAAPDREFLLAPCEFPHASPFEISTPRRRSAAPQSLREKSLAAEPSCAAAAHPSRSRSHRSRSKGLPARHRPPPGRPIRGFAPSRHRGSWRPAARSRQSCRDARAPPPTAEAKKFSLHLRAFARRWRKSRANSERVPRRRPSLARAHLVQTLRARPHGIVPPVIASRDFARKSNHRAAFPLRPGRRVLRAL